MGAPPKSVESTTQGAVSTNESPKKMCIMLSDNLREGTLHDELHELFKKMRKTVKEHIQIDDTLAGALPHYYAYNKTKKAINDIARPYTGIKSVPEVRVDALNEEIRFVEARKQAEDGFFWASKGNVVALTAITLTLALGLSRDKDDIQLDERQNLCWIQLEY